MEEPISQEGDLGEYYRLMMRSYYERLQSKREDPVRSAMEEVKLRLFLSLLDRPTRDDLSSRGGELGA